MRFSLLKSKNIKRTFGPFFVTLRVYDSVRAKVCKNIRLTRTNIIMLYVTAVGGQAERNTFFSPPPRDKILYKEIALNTARNIFIYMSWDVREGVVDMISGNRYNSPQEMRLIEFSRITTRATV